MKEDLKETIKFPEGINAKVEEEILVIKGPKGEVRRKIFHPSVKVKLINNELTLECKKATKKEKSILNTLIAHINNAIIGVKEPFTYKLKVCAGPPKSHFPAQVIFKDSTLSIKNFLGEKIPRELKIRSDVKVEIKNDEIIVQSADVESAGKTSSEIELLTNVKRKDRRIFQDGIYIIEKP